jgi:hypothetical protein
VCLVAQGIAEAFPPARLSSRFFAKRWPILWHTFRQVACKPFKAIDQAGRFSVLKHGFDSRERYQSTSAKAR